MKLFMLLSYDDWSLIVCKDQEEAEKIFKRYYKQKVDGNFNRVFEVNEVDGYLISVKEKSFSDGTDYKRS